MELRNHNFTSDISAISHHFDAPNIQPQSITKIIEEDILRESLDSPFKSTYSEEKMIEKLMQVKIITIRKWKEWEF